MEALAGLVILGALLALLVLPIVALVQASRAVREAGALRKDLGQLDARLSALAKRVVGHAAPEGLTPPLPRPGPPAGVTVPQDPAAAPAPTVTPPSPAPVPPRPSAPPPPTPAPARPAPLRPPSPLAPSPDLATNLGPKILVGVGALAVAVALAFFVKYAWENDWIGPTGRVLFGCTVSLAMMAGGLRLLDREYRPLGQGLAGAGLAGLYSAVYGAHAVYGLVPRAADFVLLLLVTASALALSVRLDARILAAIAWVGGYLTPVLLSTGEDKALSLFAYLFLLGAGAMVLDRSRPWPETAPLAMLGTIALYAGWYAQFFRAERFDVAAVGLTALTALFAVGMARKERQGTLFGVYLVASLGLALLGAQADRPWELLLLSLVLGGGALHAASLWGPSLSVVAAVAMGLPYFVWAATHARSASFAAGAVWIVGATLTYVLAGASKRVPIPIPLEARCSWSAVSSPSHSRTRRPRHGFWPPCSSRSGASPSSLAGASAAPAHRRPGGGDDPPRQLRAVCERRGAQAFLLASLVVFAAFLLGLVVRAFLGGGAWRPWAPSFTSSTQPSCGACSTGASMTRAPRPSESLRWASRRSTWSSVWPCAVSPRTSSTRAWP